MQKVLTWATLCALLAFALIWFWSESQSLAVRITTSLLVAGGGFVAGALVAMVLIEDEERGTEGSGH